MVIKTHVEILYYKNADYFNPGKRQIVRKIIKVNVDCQNDESKEQLKIARMFAKKTGIRLHRIKLVTILW